MRVTILTILIVFSSMSCASERESGDSQPVAIGVVQLLEHSDVTAVTNGLRTRLQELGREEGKDVRYVILNAQGQLSNLPQIFNELKHQKVSVVVPIFTPTAQAARREFLDTPIVFAAVTDPVGAGLISTWNHPGGNTTGISDQWPIERQLQLITRLVPDAQRVSVLYNPSEQNSMTTLEAIQEAAARLGLTIIPIPIPSTAEILQGTRLALQEGDVLYTANTISVASGLSAVLNLCYEHSTPLFAGDSAAVANGAIATYSQSYYDIGSLAANLVDRVLAGEHPGNIPVIISRSSKLYANPDSASRMGVVIPPDILKDAEVYELPSN